MREESGPSAGRDGEQFEGSYAVEEQEEEQALAQALAGEDGGMAGDEGDFPVEDGDGDGYGFDDGFLLHPDADIDADDGMLGHDLSHSHSHGPGGFPAMHGTEEGSGRRPPRAHGSSSSSSAGASSSRVSQGRFAGFQDDDGDYEEEDEEEADRAVGVLYDSDEVRLSVCATNYRRAMARPTRCVN